MATNLNSYKRSSQCSRLSVASVELEIHSSASSSTLTVNGQPSKYLWGNNTAHNPAKHSPWVVSYVHSALLRERDQYATVLSVLSGSFRKNSHPVCLSHASVSTVYSPCELGGASTEVSINPVSVSPRRLFRHRLTRQRSAVDP